MADYSNRKSIEYIVQSAMPPHSTNVLWMDTSNPELPVLKIFQNGVWVPCHTDESKEIALMAETIDALVNDIDTSDLAKEETLTTFRKDLMGGNGVDRLRPLPTLWGFKDESIYFCGAVPVEEGQEPVLVIGPISNVFMSGDYTDPSINTTYAFPFGAKTGAEFMYPINFYVPTAIPEDWIYNVNEKSWNIEGFQMVEVKEGTLVTLKEIREYRSPDNTLYGKVYLYDVDTVPAEISLASIKNSIDELSSTINALIKPDS